MVLKFVHNQTLSFDGLSHTKIQIYGGKWPPPQDVFHDPLFTLFAQSLFVKEGKSVQSTASKCTVDINTSVNCQAKNILYCISCDKCSLQYIGESERTLKERFSEHKGYVVNNMRTKATGDHYNQKGHKVSDMKITIIEKIFSSDPAVRKEREKFFINRFNTKYKGLNKITWHCQLQ